MVTRLGMVLLGCKPSTFLFRAYAAFFLTSLNSCSLERAENGDAEGGKIRNRLLLNDLWLIIVVVWKQISVDIFRMGFCSLAVFECKLTFFCIFWPRCAGSGYGDSAWNVAFRM